MSRNARFDAILKILIVIFARRVKREHRFAGRIGLDRLAFDDLTLTAVILRPCSSSKSA